MIIEQCEGASKGCHGSSSWRGFLEKVTTMLVSGRKRLGVKAGKGISVKGTACAVKQRTEFGSC